MLICSVEIYRDGEIQSVPIEIKNFPSEITIGEYDSSLKVIATERPDFMNDDNFDFDNMKASQESEFVQFMIKLVSVFCNEEEEGVLRIPMSERTTRIEGNAYAATLVNAYDFIVETINDYVPIPMSTFEHKGKTFRIPVESISKLGQKEFGPRMTVIEMVEALNAYAIFTEQQNREFIFDDYVKQSMKWVAASLAVRVMDDGKDEPQCKDLESHHKRVEERAEFFDDLTIDIALSIRSFLSGLVSS